MATKLTPAEAAEKWQRRTKNAAPDWQKGIERVTEAPGAKAAQKVDKMRQRLMDSIDDGTWARNVGAVSLDEWKSKAISKGSRRLADGIDASVNKMQAFLGDLFEHQARGQEKIRNMPDITDSDNEQRMLEWMRHMRTFNKKR
jgi:hypothetical protein